MLIAKRPGTGIETRFFDLIVGGKAKQNIQEDTILTWKMFL
jgi:N-acetylneuraminate synthase